MPRLIPIPVGILTRLARWRDVATQDVRYAMRGLRKRPGFTLTVVLTLSLGIGANATMFGILDRLLLRAPPHVVDPERVVQVHGHFIGSTGLQTSQPYIVYRDLLEQVPAFEGVAVATHTNQSRRDYYPVGRGANASRVAGSQVSPGFFPMLGVRPWRGRFFGEDEAGEQNPQKLAVIGYGYWQRQFGGRDDAIGQAIELGTERYTIVGVAPRGFTGAQLSDVDVWIPIAAADGLRFAKGTDWSTTRNSQWLHVYARLRPGASLQEARAQATAALRAGERLRDYEKAKVRADSLEAVLTSLIPGAAASSRVGELAREAQVARLLGGVALLVLLIACANVANLLLVRGVGREREIAVRLALGVTRRRLVGQLLMEGLILAALGAGGALLCARWSSGFIRTLLLGETAWSGGAVDGRVLAATIVVAVVAGLLASVVPSLQSSRPDLTASLKAGVREGGVARSPTRSVLMAAQAALAVVLLAGAGLFVRSLQNVARLPIGVDIDKVVVAGLPHASVGMTNEEAGRLFERMTEQAHAVPGVTAAATSVASSFGLGWGVRLTVPGREPPAERNNPSQYAVTPEYFQVMGIRLIDGRLFTDGDRMGTEPVVVINETTARTFWPGTNPVGQCVKLGADSMPCRTVVGIVSNARRQQLIEGPVSQVYRPLAQVPMSEIDRTLSFFGYTFLARTDGNPRAIVEPLRRMIQGMAPNVPYADVVPLRDQVDRQTRTWSLGATMFTIFGVLALVVAAVGLYSVVAFTIAQRRHEFGVRVALGATARDLVQLTLIRGMAPLVAGVLLGLLLTVASATLVAELLFEMSPRDPGVLFGVTILLVGVGALASLIPAMRARRVDPMSALRTD